ncbi:MAG: phage integrase N-terminal SAM-like domain-containing protein [Candidatus Methanosuratus sp.]|nr:phage integrase N-terminal SAM-like domain-containing protein [Candidatus Methanosuratincola sp.]
MVQYSDEQVFRFTKILERKLLTRRTVQSYANILKRFLMEFDGMDVNPDAVQKYLSKFKSKSTYRNHLSTLRVYFRSLGHGGLCGVQVPVCHYIPQAHTIEGGPKSSMIQSGARRKERSS